MKKTLKLIGNVIMYAFFAALLAVVIGYFCGVKPAVIISGSMEPAIHTGSLSFVNTKADYNKIEVNDVVVFTTSTGDQVTHRAIAISDAGIETKGDANDVSDGITTTPANFGGKTLFSIPYLGYAVTYMQEPVGMVIIGIVIVAIIAMGIVDSWADRKERKAQEENKTLDLEEN